MTHRIARFSPDTGGEILFVPRADLLDGIHACTHAELVEAMAGGDRSALRQMAGYSDAAQVDDEIVATHILEMLADGRLVAIDVTEPHHGMRPIFPGGAVMDDWSNAVPLSTLRPTAPREPDVRPSPVLAPPRVIVFDTGGLCFGTDRETFVPTRIDALLGGPNYYYLTGIDAMRHVVEHARAHPQQRICVIGHTDTVGKDASNVELSKQRAQTVHLFLAGDRDGWAALAVENQTVADWQAFLQWAHLVMGMNCDPGEVDDDLGEATQGAMHRFRATYNTRYAGALAVQGPFVVEDWKAAFDCYRKNLAEQIGESLTSLDPVLAAVQFGDPPTLACGEAFPAEHAGVDSRESARNRRVDVVFYDPQERPDFDAAPSGMAIYTQERCKRVYGSIAPSPFAMVRFCVQDADGAPQAGAVCSLMLDGQVAQATSAADGYVEFRVPANARTATLLVQGADGKGQERHIMLGGLHAVHDDAGVEGRLRNLGFDTGPDVGKQPDAVAGALSGFQQRCSLEPTGTADDATRERLAHEHGC
jgi:peptidoglycan hydrolase-like protein with peptidoglycan-binding domain